MTMTMTLTQLQWKHSCLLLLGCLALFVATVESVNDNPNKAQIATPASTPKTPVKPQELAQPAQVQPKASLPTAAPKTAQAQPKPQGTFIAAAAATQPKPLVNSGGPQTAGKTALVNSPATQANNKKQDPKCLETLEPGPCRMNLERYYFNKQTNACETFKYGGCRGNGNRWGFRQTCEEACLPKAS